ncbi:HlyU family transcriptional regulator [Vibrio sp. YMD68]|uniref:HlyU family transcriptional regulator n=1 Tax=Vibrio sp. YMD68 TaxID=3042300 RepID=UPI00249A5F19|nr:HlyU family transcriptional regulator [Vibrio sp. YMD68]WGV98132.1 HlyU family transcriptional regulator [Vibrio sp. YMD68]
MGLFSRLFGFGKSNEGIAEEVIPIEYKGFMIYQEPLAESGQYRIAGRITKQINDEVLSHRFIRSDVLSNKEDANELMLKKSQMFIDQMGDNIFS